MKTFFNLLVALFLFGNAFAQNCPMLLVKNSNGVRVKEIDLSSKDKMTIFDSCGCKINKFTVSIVQNRVSIGYGIFSGDTFSFSSIQWTKQPDGGNYYRMLITVPAQPQCNITGERILNIPGIEVDKTKYPNPADCKPEWKITGETNFVSTQSISKPFPFLTIADTSYCQCLPVKVSVVFQREETLKSWTLTENKIDLEKLHQQAKAAGIKLKKDDKIVIEVKQSELNHKICNNHRKKTFTILLTK